MENDRYKQFAKATRFIAGDEEQFQSRRDYTNSAPQYDETRVDETISFSDKYLRLSGEDVTNTFRYIFHKFKKGIYVRIRDNKVISFIPFSKIKYVNEWGDRISYDNMLFKTVSESLGYRFNDRGINKFTNKWYSNNCLVRYEYPICENDTDIENFHDLFTYMCETTIMPDTEFFINRRDFPILKHTNTEPYNHIWDSEDKALVSHSYTRYVPIFSSSAIPSKFADILFPTAEEWARARKADGMVFPKYEDVCSASDFNEDFDTKISMAVFRGASTGIGVTIETNPRLKVAYLSSIQSGPKLIDAGITKWKNRPRKLQGIRELQTINISKLGFGLVRPLTPKEQSRYKYIIHIKGYVSAYRLSYELNMGSVILLVDDADGYKMWVSRFLVPYVHYIPVKSDLSDLFTQIAWCNDNQCKMKEILIECKKIYTTYLTKDGMCRYISKLFHSLKKHTGSYTYNHFYDRQLSREIKALSVFARPTRPVPDTADRCYSKFRALQHTDMLVSLKFIRKLDHTKNTTVDIVGVKNFEFVCKRTVNTDAVHEQFIGQECINPLLKTIPNFVYTFGKTDQGLIVEKIEGINFMTWIDTCFNYIQYIHILSQIQLALIVAQRACLFVHYDLFPWNIMIQTLDTEVEIQYPVDVGNIQCIKTRLVPIIIDYGKSSAMARDYIIYSGAKPFVFDQNHDMKTITISSVKHIINNRNLIFDKYKLLHFVKVYYPNISTHYDMVRVCNEFSFSNSLAEPTIGCMKMLHNAPSQPRITKRFNIGPVGGEIKLYTFADEILSTYYSLFKSSGLIKSHITKELPTFTISEFTTLTDEMLHSMLREDEDVDDCFNNDLIDYYSMLESIINHGDENNYFKEKYAHFLKCNKLILMNYISTRNTKKNIII